MITPFKAAGGQFEGFKRSSLLTLQWN